MDACKFKENECHYCKKKQGFAEISKRQRTQPQHRNKEAQPINHLQDEPKEQGSLGVSKESEDDDIVLHEGIQLAAPNNG